MDRRHYLSYECFAVVFEQFQYFQDESIRELLWMIVFVNGRNSVNLNAMCSC